MAGDVLGVDVSRTDPNLTEGRVMKRYILFGFFALTFAANAQEDSAVPQHLQVDKSSEGRALIGQCYSSCMYQGVALGTTLIDYSVRYGPSFTTHQARNACILAQEFVRTLEACYTGCLDIEEAYGRGISSHARARYHQFYRAQRAPLMATGLWNGYKSSPNYQGTSAQQTAFAQACRRYLYGPSAASEQINDEMAIGDPTVGWPSPAETHDDIESLVDIP